MKIVVVVMLLLLVVTSCTNEDQAGTSTSSTAASPAGLIPNATIKKVIDGDTVIAEVNGSRVNVRLIGIDTPESVARNRPQSVLRRGGERLPQVSASRRHSRHADPR